MKRIIPLIIIAVLLFVISACSEKNGGNRKIKNNDENIPVSNIPQTEEKEEPKSDRYTPDLPDADYEGYEFCALIPSDKTWADCTFGAEEASGDTMNDAIYERNLYIEEIYNIKLKQLEISDWGLLENTFKNSVRAGTDDFDICVQIDRYAFSLALGGYILPADQLPHIDLTKPWYMHDVNESMKIGGKYYVVESNENLSLYQCTDVLYFNKKLVADLAFENLYSLVKNGAWTYDKFFDLCKSAVSDIDGNGTMTDADRYGIASSDDILFRNFWESSGIQSVTKNSGGEFVLNISGNEKLYNILDKAYQNLFGGAKIYFAAGKDKADTIQATNEYQDISTYQFVNDLALFYPSMLIRTEKMRNMETDFGIIPYPKYDENQSRYYVRSGGGWPKVVPSHASNPERTSVILEALAAESKNTVVPAFIEVNLRTKMARDDESAEMLDLIFDSGFGDVGTFLWLDIRDALVGAARQNNYASMVEKRSAAFEKLLNTANKAAAELN